MSQVRTSGCFCGAVQLELTGEPNVQAYCHCGSCRGWLGAPIHGATLWPTPSVKVVKGADKLVTFKKTEASHRQFCNGCGSPVLVLHPAIGMTDVPSGTIPGFAFKPTLHVHTARRCSRCWTACPSSRTFRRTSGLGRHARRVAAAERMQET
jgi:hypothetical protein